MSPETKRVAELEKQNQELQRRLATSVPSSESESEDASGKELQSLQAALSSLQRSLGPDDSTVVALQQRVDAARKVKLEGLPADKRVTTIKAFLDRKTKATKKAQADFDAAGDAFHEAKKARDKAAEALQSAKEAEEAARVQLGQAVAAETNDGGASLVAAGKDVASIWWDRMCQLPPAAQADPLLAQLLVSQHSAIQQAQAAADREVTAALERFQTAKANAEEEARKARETPAGPADDPELEAMLAGCSSVSPEEKRKLQDALKQSLAKRLKVEPPAAGGAGGGTATAAAPAVALQPTG